MDQYAPYVWAAYAVTGIGLLALCLASAWHVRRWRRKLEQLEGATPGGGPDDA